MKNVFPVFQLKHPALVGHTSESMLEHGQYSRGFEPLGLHSLIYYDSGCLYTQVHTDTGKVGGYSRFKRLILDQVQPIGSGQVGGNVGDDAQFAVEVDRNGETTLEIGDYGLVADVICDPAFASTYQALAGRPLEQFRLASFVTVDVLKFALNANGPCLFDLEKNRRSIGALAVERANLLEKYPQFGIPGPNVNPDPEVAPPTTGISMAGI
jgi:hypothetical protein